MDLGTTITFDVVSADARIPGRRDLSRASACPSRACSPGRRDCRWWTSRAGRLIGANTVSSMQSGLYYGAIGMIDGIVER